MLCILGKGFRRTFHAAEHSNDHGAANRQFESRVPKESSFGLTVLHEGDEKRMRRGGNVVEAKGQKAGCLKVIAHAEERQERGS